MDTRWRWRPGDGSRGSAWGLSHELCGSWGGKAAEGEVDSSSSRQAHPTETSPWVKPITGSTFPGGRRSAHSITLPRSPSLLLGGTCSHCKSWEKWHEAVSKGKISLPGGLAAEGEGRRDGEAGLRAVKGRVHSRAQGPGRGIPRGRVKSSPPQGQPPSLSAPETPHCASPSGNSSIQSTTLPDC